MSVYPFSIDSDATIVRISDNLTEVGGEAINQLRDATFAIESELGTGLSGSKGTLAARLDVLLNANGTPKQSALAAVGLVTLPITNSQVASNAGIKEHKLTLDHSTSDLHTLITANKSLLDIVSDLSLDTQTDLLRHLAGATTLSNSSTLARHTASMIDLNAVPSDPRDPFYTWTGLKDKNGTLRTATHVASGLLQVNEALTTHENLTADAHPATAITVDVSDFNEIPSTANTVQKALDYLDDSEFLNMGSHRATQHANAILPITRSTRLDSLEQSQIVVSKTNVLTYLVSGSVTDPQDNNTAGDDVIRFIPTNTASVFDAQFSQVQPGDLIRVNYGLVESLHYIDSVRFIPGSQWFVRINGVNLFDTVSDGYDGYVTAQIERPQYDLNTYGVMALASANSIPNDTYPNLMSSLIVGSPRGATALGLGFDGNKINSTHYNLYLELYPTGNPADKIISMLPIDVSGDAGATCGSYTLDKIVHKTNDAFRKLGYNYRFIAFDHKGEFGLMLADSIGSASFAIVSGTASSGSLMPGGFSNNVIGDATDGFDALGFGLNRANVAGPNYTGTYDTTTALFPTKVINPAKSRSYVVNGQRRDTFAATHLANSDGYWNAVVNSRTLVGTTIEVTYRVELSLCASELKPGKTIVVQPEVAYDSSTYFDVDYGRFIIKSVSFEEPCGDEDAYTLITVINGLHNAGAASAFSSEAGLKVHLYFSEDSVSFNDSQMIDAATGVNYHRLHEIYVTDAGKTHAHERARLPVQSETGVKLRTESWHISNVSPKLRGYKDGTSAMNRYLRFFIISYSAATGVIDGYVGQRDPANPTAAKISRPGPLTRGYKNQIIRYYDETYADYIELYFDEPGPGPTGVNILSDVTPRFVDIELFSSVKLHDEYFALGTCEVNWDPPTGQNIVQHVRNTRQFGSVDETDLTQTAVDFVSAADRVSHENGVVSGLDFREANPSNVRELLFDGGQTLIDGKLVISTSESVTIPLISKNAAVSTGLAWYVCLDITGHLVCIPADDSFSAETQQYFQTPGSMLGTYFLPSANLVKLINSTSYVPVALVELTIGADGLVSGALNVRDIRRFVNKQTFSGPLTVSSNDRSANFYDFTSLSNWIAAYGTEKTLVKICGEIILSGTLNLGGFENRVVFEGDGAIIRCNADRGITINTNTHLKNITFYFRQQTSIQGSGINFNATTGNFVNPGNGCIYSDGGDDIRIEDCIFIFESGALDVQNTKRHPFISFRNGDFRDVVIKDNFIKDQSGAFETQCAIAITTNQGNFLENVLIEGNRCTDNNGLGTQSIYIGPDVVSTGSYSMLAQNVTIRDNTCGVIGHFVRTGPLFIERNTCSVIASSDATGFFSGSDAVDYDTGTAIISQNKASYIRYNAKDFQTASSVQIINNVLDSLFDISVLDDHVDDAWSDQNYAISILNVDNSTNANSYLISGNTILGNGVGYYIGITCDCAAIISNNIIRKFSGYGILPAPQISGTIVSGNQIYRGANSVLGYVFPLPANSSVSGTIVDNFFDSPFISGTNTAVVAAYPAGWIIERNKNQSNTLAVSAHAGAHSVTVNVNGNILNDNGTTSAPGMLVAGGYNQTIASTIYAENAIFLNSEFIGTSGPAVRFVDSPADSAFFIEFEWAVNLIESLPQNVTITRITASYTPSSDPTAWTTKLFSLKLSDSAGAVSNNTGLVANGAIEYRVIGTNPGTLPATPAPVVVPFDRAYQVTYGANPTIRTIGVLKVAAGAFVSVSLNIEFRW